jgi:hypothetical protein
MGLLSRLSSFVSLHRKISPSSAIAPPSPTQPLQTQSSASPLTTPSQPQTKSLTELEREISLEARSFRVHPQGKVAASGKRRILNKIIWMALLTGIPVGLLWLINLPYPPIRRPIARTAPVLLLPSYIGIDSNYRQAIALTEQARQLIDGATTPVDLDMGAEKLKQAQTSLNALPLWIWDDLPDARYWWYGWQLSASGFNAARREIGRLEAKVFQEKNAQNTLFDAEQGLNQAKQQYQQAKTSVDKQAAIAAWQSAIDQLKQIPGQTLAGKTAQQELAAAERDFQSVVGLAAGNERTQTLILTARSFATQAAQASQHPPHSVEEWRQISSLWQEAITRLEQIPSNDLAGYAEAQKSLATYRANLGQIETRQQAEQESVQTLQETQTQIQSLLASVPADAKALNRNYTVSQLQGIIDRLERVQPGTTVYLKAQQLLWQAQNKLNQLKPQE